MLTLIAALFLLFLLSGLPMVTDLFSGWAPQALLDAIAGFSFLAHFSTISRGVIDLRDLYYYLALTLAFLALNVYTLDRERWAETRQPRHRAWRLGSVLLLANLLLGALWLQQLPQLQLHFAHLQ